MLENCPLQVLRLLDMVGLPELVIQLATLAVMESADDWRSQVQITFASRCFFRELTWDFLLTWRAHNVLLCALWCFQATLRTCIFKHHLDLGHNSEAYVALTQNPDPSR